MSTFEKRMRHRFKVTAAPRSVIVKPNKARNNILNNTKKAFPRLSDPNIKAADLQAEFSPYSALAKWYYDTTAKVATYLRAHLNTRNVIASTPEARDNGITSVIGSNPSLSYDNLVRSGMATAVSSGKKLRIKGNEVWVNLQPLTFNVAVKFSGTDQSDLINKLTKLFGEFTIPKRTVLGEDNQRVVDAPKYATGLKGVDFYKRLKFEPDAFPGYYQPEDIDIDPVEGGTKKKKTDTDPGKISRRKINLVSVKDALNIDVRISSITARKYGYEVSDDNLDGAILTFRFAVNGICKFPLEYALWSTNATDLTEFVPKLFREHFDNIGQMFVLAKGKAKYEAKLHSRTMHFGTIKELNNQRIKEYNIVVEPRVNKENYCIMSNGRVLYVPTEDNCDFYTKVLRDSYDADTGIVKSNSQLPEIRNRFIMADWVNDVLAFTDDSGKPSTILISGSIPLDDITINRNLYVILSHQSDDYVDTICSIGNKIAAEFNLYNKDFQDDPNKRIYGNYAMLYNTVANFTSELVYPDAYNAANSADEDVLNKLQKEIFLEFVRLNKAISDKMMASREVSLRTRLTHKFDFDIFGTYIKSVKVFDKVFRDSIIANHNPLTDELKTSFSIPNAPGINKILPHQQETATVVSRDDPPKLLVLSIAAGGGKCAVGSTIVTTDKGLLSLKELRNMSEKDNNKGFRSLNGINVIGSNGITSANATYSRMGKTVKVVFSDGTEFEGLPQHKLHNDKDFIKLSDIKIGTFFPKKIGLNVYGNVDSLQINNNRFTNVLTKPLARLIGYIVAEGYNSECRATVTITMTNPQIQEIIKKDIKEVFEEDLEFKDNTVKFNAEISKYLQQLVSPATSARITVPLCIRQASEEMQIEFLRAIFEGDGCCYLDNNGRWHLNYATISKKLAHQVKIILENIGFAIKLAKKTSYYSSNGNASIGHVVTKRIPYELQIHYNDFERFAEDIGFVSDVKIAELTKAIKYFKNQINNQNTNNQVFGIENTMPDTEAYRRLLTHFDNLLNKIQYQVISGNKQQTFSLTAANVFRLLGSEHTSRQVNKHIKGDFSRRLTKFNARLLLNIIDDIDKHEYISDKQANKIWNDETLISLRKNLKDQIDTVWIEVTNKVKGKYRRVYDLSVPETHDYTANNLLSHNTLQLFMDVMIQKQAGRVKTAMIVCPSNLVKEWTSEINRYSKGEVNVIPITTSVIRRMREHLGFDKQKFLDYLKSAPINTIFVCSLNFLGLTTDHFSNENLGEQMQYGENFIRFFPNVQILRQLKPDYIALDESHYAKNETAKRTHAFFGLSPVAKYRRIASGTINPDNPVDMVSQYAILNPAILGNRKAFLNKYAIEQNGKAISLQEGGADAIARVRKPYLTSINKARATWGFLLPRIDIHLTKCIMTPNQQLYYDFMLSAKMKELKNDPRIQKLIAEADQKKQEQLEKLLDAKLNVLETFVNAPDSNDAFQKWADGGMDENGEVTAALRIRVKLVDEDFISCKVRKIDDIVNNRFNIEKSPNKIIVFGINKLVSRHIFRHTRFRSVALHYAASASDSLTKMSAAETIMKFRGDPRYRLLIADATSMREGLNIQISDTVIYVQSEWSPGPQEQAISRVLRPDVGGIYKRESILVTKLYAENTFEVAKVAKLINKEVITKSVENADNNDWKRFVQNTGIPELKPITLSLETLQKVKTFDDVKATIQCYGTINAWEHNQFGVEKERLIQYTANRLHIPIEKVDLMRDAVLPADGNSKIVGSKYIFTPLESGATPVDKRNLNMMPIAVAKRKDPTDPETGNIDADEDEDSDIDDTKVEIEDNVSYSEGDIVWTDLGWGKIVTDLVKQVKVAIPGLPNKTYTFPKMAVFKPQPPGEGNPFISQEQWEANFNKLKSDIKKAGDKGITFINGDNFVSSETPTVERDKPPPKAIHPSLTDEQKIKIKPPKTETAPVPVAPPKPPKNAPFPKAAHKIEIQPMILNGQAVLCAYTTEEGFDKLAQDYGNWKKVPPFLYTQVQTYNGALRLSKAITDAGLTVAAGPIDPKTKKQMPNQLSRMQGLAKKLRGTNDPNLLVRNYTQKYTTGLKNPFVFDHSTALPNVVKLYTMLWNEELFLVAPISVQQKQIAKLRKMRVQGCTAWKPTKDFAICVLPGPNRMKNLLKEMAANEKITNYDDAMDIISDPTFKAMIGL